MARIVVLRVEMGPLVTGIWCDTCLTSGRVAARLYHWRQDGPHLLRTVSGCTTCHEREQDPT